MSTKFQPIQIPPGVVTNPTKNMRSSNWAEINLCRWIEGELQPVGGQSQIQFPSSATFASRCKVIHPWIDLTGALHIAYVCERNVYVDNGGTGANLTEITPNGGWAAPPMPTQGGYGDLLYGEDLYGTPRALGTILPINQLPNAWSADNFGQILLVMYSVDGRLLEWNPTVSANANDVQTLTLIGSPTGGTFALTFNGQTTAAIQWNATAANVQSALVALTNIGTGNVVCTGGPLPAAVTITFQGTLGNSLQSTIGWANNTLIGGTGPQPNVVHTTNGANLLLTRTSGSPMGRCFVVTQERFVQIFGMYQDGTIDGGSPRRFGWCDQENRNAWNFSTVTSQAGFLDIEPASPIICADTGRFGTLFFTGKKAYICRYIGLPYVYNYVELADDCTPYSPASITSTSSLVLWMGQQGLFMFDGTTISPVACLVRPWITDQIDPVNVREQACAVHVWRFNEFWWFFPAQATGIASPNTNSPYNNLCVIYNYKEGWWSQGRMQRSAGIVGSYLTLPIMANGTVAIQHEYPGGTAYVNADLPWAETFDLNLTSGVRLATLKQLMPDLGGDVTNVQFAFWAGMSRAQGLTGGWGPPVQQRSDGYVDVRVTGRDLRMRISTVSAIINPFTVGQHLVDYAIRGDR